MGRTPSGETRGKIWKFVRERLLAGRPPTVREVQEAFGFRAVQTAREHLEVLVAEGRLTKEPGRARGYRLPFTEDEAPVLVPILGRVSAGALDYAVEDLEGYVAVQVRSGQVPSGQMPVPSGQMPAGRGTRGRKQSGRKQSGQKQPGQKQPGQRQVSPKQAGQQSSWGSELFGLRVRGQSMRDAGILPGDIVVVRRQNTARSGDIVVALIGEEATIKRLRLRGRRVELHPENPDFKPVVFDSRVPASEEVTLLGRVIEVRRFL